MGVFPITHLLLNNLLPSHLPLRGRPGEGVLSLENKKARLFFKRRALCLIFQILIKGPHLHPRDGDAI
jgi:hypothetical protein